jgi:hypothetical protein
MIIWPYLGKYHKYARGAMLMYGKYLVGRELENG